MTILRFLQILYAFAALLVWRGLRRLRLIGRDESPSQRCCRTLTDLGGSFVKLGQMLSIRRDLLPDEYAAALGALQDRVPPFASESARTAIEQSLNEPVDTLFSEFENNPLAAASLAQVHRARLATGEDVVVKVRRPGVKESVVRDMALLRWIVRLIVRMLPPLRRYRPLELLRELEHHLKRELDFRVEARNIQRFAEGMKGFAGIHVPQVVRNLYAERVLITELSGGCRVDDPEVVDGPRLAKDFVEAYLHQFFVMGFFHGDPHPGNLFIRPDGRICFHDLGLVGHLNQRMRRNLAAFVQAMVNNDGDWLVDAYMDLGVITGDVDRVALRRGLEDMLKQYASMPVGQWSFGEAFLEVIRIGKLQNVRLPHNLLVFMRASFLMENTVRTLDPQYNLVQGLVDKADEIGEAIRSREQDKDATARLKFELGALAQDLPTALAKYTRTIRDEGVELPLKVRGLAEFGARLERSADRLVIALLAGVLYLAASLLMQHSIGPRLWGFPVLSLIGYVWAVWLTWSLLRGMRNAR